MPQIRSSRVSPLSGSWLSSFILGIAFLVPLACAERAQDPQPVAASPETLLSDGPHEVVVLEIQNMGEIRFELLPEVAPGTVAHFKRLIASGFYTGTYFHRVVPGFMIQGGDPFSKDRDPRNDGNGGLEETIPDEFNALSHVRGSVALANKGHGTASSQFFIVQEDSPHLDGDYTIFGRVVEGMDVVDRITELEIDKFGRWGPRDRPYPVQAVVGGARVEGVEVAGEVASVRPENSFRKQQVPLGGGS